MGRHIILTGIGQSGCMAADLFSHKMNQHGIRVSALGVDTDERSLSKMEYAYAVPMVDSRSLNSVVETLGAENIKSWFPCVWDQDDTEFIRYLEMNQGTNQWRMKALLAFASFLSKGKLVEKFHSAIDRAIEGDDADKEIELYFVSSLAGGTGSGLFLPMALYIKKYIESKELSIKTSSALLLMPDIYDNCFTADQKIKSYANAYAALREYHAVLACTNPANADAQDEKHPPIGFKLGDENGALGLLFDTEKTEYQDPAANPFNKVYLFERMPNVSSIETHIEVITDVAISMCNHAEEQTDHENVKLKYPDAIFGGVSLVKVRYPVDSIVAYISKKQLYDCVAVEMCHVHKAVMAELDRCRGEARLYGVVFDENTDRYCDAYISVCEKMVSESGTSLSLINRAPKIFENDHVSDHIWNVDYLAQLTRLADESFDCESARTLQNIICPPTVNELADGAGKKKRKENYSKKQLLTKAQESGELLLDFYRNGIRSVVNGRQAFMDSLIPEEVREDKFSLLNNILCMDGEYLHPTFALLRLCLVYKELSTYCKKIAIETYDASEIENLLIPYRLTRTDRIYGAKSAYGKLGEERFRILAFGESPATPKIADDQGLFYTDLEQVYVQVKGYLRAYRYKEILKALDDIIGKYRRFVHTVWQMTDDIFEEMRVALRNCTNTNGNVVNVGASEAEKEAAYNVYWEIYRKDPHAISNCTKFMGKCVYSVLRKYNPNDSVRGAVLDTLKEVDDLLVQQCRNSDFYQNYLLKNIYSAISDSIAKKELGLTLSKVFKGRNPSVRVKMPEKFEESAAVRSVTTAKFGKSIEKFLSLLVITEENVSAKEHIEKMMYDAGEYYGDADFAEYIADGEMLLQTETENLRLYFVNAVNELDEEHIGYKCYLKAMDRAVRLNARMWNPHLVYTRGEGLQLPYINPHMQIRYETEVAEAVLFALWAKKLRVEQVADIGDVYFICLDDDYEPLRCGDSYITAERPEEMMMWAYKNRNWVLNNSLEFEKMQAEEMTHIPSQRDGYNIKGAVERALSDSEIMTLLKEDLLELIFALHKRVGSLDGGFEIRLADVGIKTVLKYCQKAYGGGFHENYIGLFNKQIETWISAFAEKNGKDHADELVRWLNSQGYFKPLERLDWAI